MGSPRKPVNVPYFRAQRLITRSQADLKAQADALSTARANLLA